MRRRLAALIPLPALDELRRQNDDLINALADLQQQKEELLRLNAELEETNQGVMALYGQLSDELEQTNQGVVALYRELALTARGICRHRSYAFMLTALGLDTERANGAIRIGFGRFTTTAEIDRAAAQIGAAVRALAGARARRHIGEVAVSPQND